MRINKHFLFFIFSLIFSTNVMALEMEEQDTAVLGSLNKITGRNSTIEIDRYKKGKFGDIEIEVLSCQKSSPLDTPESASYLKITEEGEMLFKGWMYASSPALSAMDNGIYDIWVINCKNKDIPEIKEIIEIPEKILVK